jgi:1,4-dihydroxy-2-naphthoate octaprenyltransferase
MATPAQWLEGARPRTLPAAVAPVLAGTGVAAHVDAVVWWKAAMAMVVAVALQVGVNYANDYSDGVRGTDTDRVGPLRLVGSGAAPPGAVKTAAFASFGLACAAGLAIAAATAWWLVTVGAVCIVAAWFYTGGSSPYGYRGLGEVMVFVFFGLVAVVGTAYVQVSGGIRYGWAVVGHPIRANPWWSLWLPAAVYAGIGIGALACAILVANNLRDIPTDRATGKHTLAVLIGEERARYLYVLLLALAVAALVGVAATTTGLALLGLLFLVPAVPAARRVLAGSAGRDLVPVLAQTGLAELLFGLILLFTLLL